MQAYSATGPKAVYEASSPASTWGPLYNQLIEFNPETADPYDLRGDLARSWSLAGDGVTYTFRLNENARWWDGKPVIAEDVVFSFTIMVDPGSIPTTKGTTPIIGTLIPFYYESSRVIDEHTVEVKSRFPAANFITTVALDRVKIQPKHVVVDQGKLQSFKNPENLMGSGPFKLEKFVKDVSIAYVRNNDSFKEPLRHPRKRHHNSSLQDRTGLDAKCTS
jgi:peptide/nickel transport system substrate-binding protein